MLKLIITKFWPAFIPVLIYFAWRIYAKKSNNPHQKKEIYFLALFMLLFLIISILFIAFNQEGYEKEDYQIKNNDFRKTVN